SSLAYAKVSWLKSKWRPVLTGWVEAQPHKTKAKSRHANDAKAQACEGLRPWHAVRDWILSQSTFALMAATPPWLCAVIAGRRNPVGVELSSITLPRLARSSTFAKATVDESRPWTLRRNPVGIEFRTASSPGSRDTCKVQIG